MDNSLAIHNHFNLKPLQSISESQQEAIRIQGFIGRAQKTSPYAYEALRSAAIAVAAVVVGVFATYGATPFIASAAGLSFKGAYLASYPLLTFVVNFLLHQINNITHWFDARAARIVLAKKEDDLGGIFGFFNRVEARLGHKPTGVTPPASPVSQKASTDASSSSSDAPVKEAPNAAETAVQVHKFALIIGNNYPTSHAHLSNCYNDTVDQVQLYGHAGFGGKNVTVMTDKQENKGTDLEPTAINIGKQIDIVIDKANAVAIAKLDSHHSASTHTPPPLNPDTVIVFHFSGHGTTKANPQETSGYDSLLVGTDMQMIIDDDLRKKVDRLHPNVAFLGTADCCHSGDLFDEESNNEYSVDYVNGRAQIKAVEKNDKMDSGFVAIFSGCKVNQVSSDGKGAGAMTLAYYTTIMEHNYDLTWEELLLGMNDKIRAAGIPNQNPVLTTSRKIKLKAKVFESEVHFQLHGAAAVTV
jgi:Caspase domain